MSSQAKVTSVEALESFRTYLILYISKARPTVDEVGAEVLRVRNWLQNDQRVHWEGQVRRCQRTLETAKQELFSAKLSNLRDTSAAEIMAVRRAERALDHAETKLRLVKKWNRDFESQMAPLAKQLEKMNTILANDLPVATAYLAETINILSAYSEIGNTPRQGDPT